MPFRFFFVWIVSMSEVSKKSGDVTLTEFTEDGKLVRKIRSFVRREGRLTKGQEMAMEKTGQQWVLTSLSRCWTGKKCTTVKHQWYWKSASAWVPLW
ncbi:tRNA (guanine46-N7-)-methyltransferase [Photobacterium aphoticum]|uniref:tRNA (Guanine46-N7-)-methyltransferase n=1 Tax=Photobacterium aphoticum TaxID=754436 RepID=A0A090R1H6_9GAMM|nr:tRNA (guanine46-N7-)-methyltransferase [Photobacterium aphoticum]